MTPLIEVRNLRFTYGGAERPALDGLELVVDEDELVCVVGPNGSGKSTLARILAGLARPDAADVARVAGHDLLTREGRMAVRRDAGILFQNPDNQIVGTTVEEDVAFGLENLALDAAEIRVRVDEMLDSFDLTALATREPHLLSAGQKQRTALAGVLAIPRRLLVLDEPTAMLDPTGATEVLAALGRARADGLTVVHVTQEMDEVRSAGRVVAVEGGRSVFDGSPEELFSRADTVTRLSLGLPPAAALAVALERRGVAIGVLPLTVEGLVAALESRA